MTTNGDTSSLPAPAGDSIPRRRGGRGSKTFSWGRAESARGGGCCYSFFCCSGASKREAFTLKHVPGVDAWFKTQDPNVFTPPLAIFSESILLFGLVVATSVMALIEKRTYTDYYLPMNQFLGKKFWQGVPYGFAMLSLLLVLIAAFHGFSLGNVALSGADALKFGALYGIAFLMVGMFEEFSFPRLHAGDAGAVNRVLAGGDYSLDHVWRDPFEQSAAKRGTARRWRGRLECWRRSACSGRGTSGSRLGCTPRGIGPRRFFIRCRIADFWRRDIYLIPLFMGLRG